jgi:hypothetical protein
MRWSGLKNTVAIRLRELRGRSFWFLASAFANPPSLKLWRDKGYGETSRFGSVTGFGKPAPSPKPRQKPKILAPNWLQYFFKPL